MHAAHTFLAPGQRYIQPGSVDWRADHQVTISRLDRDAFGVSRVTFRAPDGREFTAYAAQIEAAIADGQLTPIVGAGTIGRC